MTNANGKKLRFGELVVRAGHVKAEAVEKALALQRKRDEVGESHKLLGIILLEMGELSNDQLIDTLKRMQRSSQRLPKNGAAS